MRKIVSLLLMLSLTLVLTACNAEETAVTAEIDYPAAIMVNDIIYLFEGEPMAGEVDENAILGYTESYTDTFPAKNGETNFNRELEMPYAQVENGIAVLYENEWHLCIPK